MNTKLLKVIKIKQPIGEFYICKLNANDLINMAITDIRRIELGEEDINGIQRELNLEKVREIKKYLRLRDASFPNSIILNVNKNYVLSENEDRLELIIANDTFSILDGQHRLEGFRNNNINNFELVVSIFINLDISQQANIFSTINTKQTKVDPSLNLNLELSSKLYTPKKMIIQIAQTFNEKSSPWVNNIKMLGKGTEGIISLKAFVTPIFELTFPESKYIDIKDELDSLYEAGEHNGDNNYVKALNSVSVDKERYIFWEQYHQNEPYVIYKILFNYFSSLEKIFKQDWLNSRSILNKTTGYNALMKLMKQIYKEGLNKNDLSEEFFYYRLKPLETLDGKINTDNFGASGDQASGKLYSKFLKILNITEEN